MDKTISLTDEQWKLKKTIYGYCEVSHRCTSGQLQSLEDQVYILFNHNNPAEKTEIIALQKVINVAKEECFKNGVNNNVFVQTMPSLLKTAQMKELVEKKLNPQQEELRLLAYRYNKDPSLASPMLIAAVIADISKKFNSPELKKTQTELLNLLDCPLIDVSLAALSKPVLCDKNECILAIKQIAFVLDKTNKKSKDVTEYCVTQLAMVRPVAIKNFEFDADFEKETIVPLMVISSHNSKFAPPLVCQYKRIVDKVERYKGRHDANEILKINIRNGSDVIAQQQALQSKMTKFCNKVRQVLPEWEKTIDRYALLTNKNVNTIKQDLQYIKNNQK